MNAFFGDACEDIDKYVESIIKEQNYPLEKHTVTTEDGYVNSMYRIPYGKKTSSQNGTPGPPVLLLHGMSCSCAVFVNGGVLAYYLADEGFDVWLPNTRGTTFSRKHKKFDADEDKHDYWNFSWHEIGTYDTPAFIDHILQVTGFEKLHFVGHSQGATTFAVFLSERPQYNDKIALSCLLGAPIIFQNNTSHRVTIISKLFIQTIEIAHRYFGLSIHQMPFVSLMRTIGQYVKPNSLLAELYGTFFSLVAGNPNVEQISDMDIQKISITTPNSFSIQQPYHYLQVIRSGRFAKYDYGPDKNNRIYGSTTPPLYDLSKIRAPVALFSSKNDMYFNPKDEEKLEEMLSNVVYKHLVEDELFNHADFLFAKDSIELVYSHMVKLMKQYNPVKYL
ncbi:hypothetical protein WA026_023401 [Henosepilachna vigintioctopunctata]|uniref:Lipase n=1 Tax=Henosepilachna vigintioctopunctata TaxID=420089 RepID=A0AAW1UEX2_9CUCU